MEHMDAQMQARYEGYEQERREAAARIVVLEIALKAVLAGHTYKTGDGGTNCRFCDNSMDHEGTHRDMHDSTCIVHTLRAITPIS